MLEPQERTLLNGFYKNASVGADATVNILDKVTHPDLREELCTQLEYYRKQKQEICRQMQEAYAIPQEQGAMAKFCANVSLQMRCMGNQSNSNIAKQMLEGTNMGVIQLTQLMHRCPDVPEKLRRQGSEIVRREEAYMERLKPYL